MTTPTISAIEPVSSKNHTGASNGALWTLIGVQGLCFLGSEISRFGVSIWIYRATGSVNAFAMLIFANSVPGLLIAPAAGNVVDRFPRKLVMIFASAVAMIGTLIVLGGASFGHLSMPLILAGAALASISEAFVWPALSATVPLMASKSELPRFNGYVESARAMSQLAGPVMGGILFATLNVVGLLSIEVTTFLIGMSVLALLAIPKQHAGAAGEDQPVLADSLFGLKWIWRHRPLFLFLCVAVFGNIFLNIGLVLMAPYGLSVLDEKSYGLANGLFGGGMIAGGVIYGFLSKKFQNIQIFFASALAMGLLYSSYGLARELWSFGSINFLTAMMMTITNAGILTIWQLKVPEEQAGRVLSAVRMVAFSGGPVCYLMAGPLAEGVVPRLLSGSGALPRLAQEVWGSGKTAQLGFLFSVMGGLMFTGFLLAMLVKDIRDVEAC